MKRVAARTRSFTGGSITPGSTVPGAPTIGTATAGNTTASVTFTPPGNDGGAMITSYRATSTPGGITATGASSPITVTGLTNGTAYTFTVAAQNANGFGAESAASNSVTPSAANLITNGDFSNSGTWTPGVDWDINSGQAIRVASSGASAISQPVASTQGVTYRVTWTLTRNAGSFRIQLLGTTTVLGTTRSASGTYQEDLVAPAGSVTFAIQATLASSDGSVDNVSMVPL